MSKKKSSLCKGFNKPTKEESLSMNDFLNSNIGRGVETPYDDENEIEDEVYDSLDDLFNEPDDESEEYDTPSKPIEQDRNIKDIIKEKKYNQNKYSHKEGPGMAKEEIEKYIVTPWSEFGIKVDTDLKNVDECIFTTLMKSRRSSFLLNGRRIFIDNENDEYFNYDKLVDFYNDAQQQQKIMSAIYFLLTFTSTPDIIMSTDQFEEFSDKYATSSDGGDILIEEVEDVETGDLFYQFWTISDKARNKFTQSLVFMLRHQKLLSTALQVLSYAGSGYNGKIDMDVMYEYVSSEDEIEDYTGYLLKNNFIIQKESGKEYKNIEVWEEAFERFYHETFNILSSFSAETTQREEPTEKVEFTKSDIREAMDNFGEVEDDDEEDEDEYDGVDTDGTPVMSAFGVKDEYYENVESDLEDVESDDDDTPKEDDNSFVIKPIKRTV